MSKIAVLLTPGFADWEYGLIAGTGGPFYGLDVRFFAAAAGPVTSQGGLTASVPQDLDDLEAWQPDVVVLVGGTGWEAGAAPDLGDLLRGLHGRGAILAGICGGTLALARAGLLDDVRHTSNQPGFLVENAPDYGGIARYVESPCAVSEEGIITAPGTAPASFAAAVFAAAGLSEDTVGQFRAMMAAEHAQA